MLSFYTPTASPRFYYCLELLCTQIWEIPYEILHNLPIDPNKQVIVYDENAQNSAFHIIPTGLLTETTVAKKEINVVKRTDNYRYSFFQTNSSADIDFDILSAIFYLVSRYEELIEPITDHHGRYVCDQSLAFREGFLELPLVNIWCETLRQSVQKQVGIAIPNKNSFSIVNTIDIDNAFALTNKGWWRTLAGFSRSTVKGNFSRVNLRLKVIKGRINDPYDTYSYILNTAKRNDVETIFFVLVGDYDRYDKNSSHKNRNFQSLLQNLSKEATLAIHPSYASYLRVEHVGIEQQRLKKIITKPIIHSRQHFLRLQLPDSYRILVENELQHDYSMGYPERPGFRASICTPFSFYDIFANEILPLTIHPFAYMDGTLNEYMKLAPNEASIKIKELKDIVRKFNGEFIGIWHNDTVGENYHWKGWKKVFEESLTQ
jgi:hypothetical protein